MYAYSSNPPVFTTHDALEQIAQLIMAFQYQYFQGYPLISGLKYSSKERGLAMKTDITTTIKFSFR